jgi:hypothetical protein
MRAPATKQAEGLGQAALAPWCFYPAVIQQLTREPMGTGEFSPLRLPGAQREFTQETGLRRDSAVELVAADADMRGAAGSRPCLLSRPAGRPVGAAAS